MDKNLIIRDQILDTIRVLNDMLKIQADFLNSLKGDPIPGDFPHFAWERLRVYKLSLRRLFHLLDETKGLGALPKDVKKIKEKIKGV